MSHPSDTLSGMCPSPHYPEQKPEGSEKKEKNGVNGCLPAKLKIQTYLSLTRVFLPWKF
jgi:hypothetical protein